jgi:hypothetical protein
MVDTDMADGIQEDMGMDTMMTTIQVTTADTVDMAVAAFLASNRSKK